MKTIHFGSGSFKNLLWIKGKMVFEKIIDVNVEFTNAGDFYWLVADSSGKVVKDLLHQNKAGWTGLHFSSLGLFGDYSVGFKNASKNDLIIKQGDVRVE